MRTEELLAIGAEHVATSQRLRADVRALRALTDWNVASAHIVRQRRPWISGGVDTPDQQTRDRIRELLNAWGIHRSRGLTLWAGKSRGGYVCAACRRDIPTGQIEYDIVIAKTVSFLFHRACFESWATEVDTEP
jgi:hypothetical protein